MLHETIAQLRAQAAHARKLADEMYNREAQEELRAIADTLDAKANELERQPLNLTIAPSKPA